MDIKEEAAKAFRLLDEASGITAQIGTAYLRQGNKEAGTQIMDQVVLPILNVLTSLSMLTVGQVDPSLLLIKAYGEAVSQSNKEAA